MKLQRSASDQLTENTEMPVYVNNHVGIKSTRNTQ